MRQEIKLKENKRKSLWIILDIILIVILLLVGFLRIIDLGTEKIDVKILVYIIVSIVFFSIFIYLDKELRRNYYTSKIYSSRLLAGGYTLVTLIFPKGCFKKQNFSKGYFIYLTSRISLILFIYLIIKLIIMPK